MLELGVILKRANEIMDQTYPDQGGVESDEVRALAEVLVDAINAEVHELRRYILRRG